MDVEKPTIFIVDDDASVRRALTRLFEPTGFKVATRASAEEFLEIYDAKRPGCLILDVGMPGMSGLELQERLNAMEGEALPIIFITGHGDAHTKARAMNAGAMDFFEKPVDSQALIDAVRRVIRTIET